ncbi:MAG: NAD nucleotidase [Acidimicrobiales bacterium]
MRARKALAGLLAVAMMSTAAAVGGVAPAASQTDDSSVVAAEQLSVDQIRRLYKTVLGREADQAGLDYWMEVAAGGATYDDLTWAFTASDEWNNSVGDGLSDAEFVNRLYVQALGRPADAAGLSYWVDDILGSGSPQHSIIRWFAESDEQKNLTGTAAEGLSLNILHINDHHSHLEGDDIGLELGGAETDVDFGGFARVVAKFKELERELEAAGENVAKIHAGDAITGTLFYSLFKGEPDAALMNEICFDAFALGNHEFDDGDAGLANFLDFLRAGPYCQTPVLAANVVPGPSSPLAEGYLRDRIVYDYNGESVAYVGIDIASKTKNSSSPDPDTQFLDEVATAQAQINELRAEGINKVVLVTHYQYDNDLALASMVNGVDVIIGGDSHTLLGDEFAQYGLNPQGPYPTMTTDSVGAPVCIAQAWEYSQIVGHISVTWDEFGLVTSCEGTPHLLIGDNFSREVDDEDVALEGAELQAVLDQVAAAPELSIVEPDARATEIIESFASRVEAETARVIGTVTEDLCLERIPGQGRSTICDVSDTAQRGGDIQQLVAEAFRARSFESDISIQNAGGVRIDVPAGDLTIATAYTILPFSNTMVNLEMTGVEIKQVLEDGFDFALQPDGSTGAYPYAAGLRWDADATAAKGSRLTNLEYQAKGSTDWVPFDPGATYTVVTNDFIAAGRDGYLTFAEIDDSRIVDTFINYAQGLIDYVELDLNGVVSKPPAENYSTQSFVPAG